MFDKIKKAIKEPVIFFVWLNSNTFLRFPDKSYLSIVYQKKMGEKINWKNPQTFNEKLQWLKLNDKNPKYTQMVDKYETKKYIEKTIGKEYVIPTLGIYNNFEEIDFDKLPNQFVIKCTHDSGGIAICKDKATFDKNAAKKKIEKSLKRNYYWSGREWPYKNVKPRIIVEKLLENDDKSELVEYDFFCFNGEPKIVSLCYGDKDTNRYNDYYDINFKKLDFSCSYKTAKEPTKQPPQFAKMVNIAKKLSKDIPFLRVDLYLCNDKIYSSELTFYHWSGYGHFSPKIWDKKLGEWIKLPNEK